MWRQCWPGVQQDESAFTCACGHLACLTLRPTCTGTSGAFGIDCFPIPPYRRWCRSSSAAPTCSSLTWPPTRPSRSWAAAEAPRTARCTASSPSSSPARCRCGIHWHVSSGPVLWLRLRLASVGGGGVGPWAAASAARGDCCPRLCPGGSSAFSSPLHLLTVAGYLPSATRRTTRRLPPAARARARLRRWASAARTRWPRCGCWPSWAWRTARRRSASTRSRWVKVLGRCVWHAVVQGACGGWLNHQQLVAELRVCRASQLKIWTVALPTAGGAGPGGGRGGGRRGAGHWQAHH